MRFCWRLFYFVYSLGWKCISDSLVLPKNGQVKIPSVFASFSFSEYRRLCVKEDTPSLNLISFLKTPFCGKQIIFKRMAFLNED